jgi:hypothetical protein
MLTQILMQSLEKKSFVFLDKVIETLKLLLTVCKRQSDTWIAG